MVVVVEHGMWTDVDDTRYRLAVIFIWLPACEFSLILCI